VRCTNLLIAVGTNYKEGPDLGLSDEPLQKFDGRYIYPLHIIKEEHQRVFRPGKYA
jgi:hypothetical protein